MVFSQQVSCLLEMAFRKKIKNLAYRYSRLLKCRLIRGREEKGIVLPERTGLLPSLPRRTPGAELANMKNKYQNLTNEARHVAVSKSTAKANEQQTNRVIANIKA